MKKLNLLTGLLCVLLPLTACALSGDAIEGRVLEEGTGKPIPDAIVVVRWEGRVSSLADSHGVCVHVDSMVSDSQGRYKFTRWSKSSKVGPVFNVKSIVTAYKPGYELSQEYFDKQTYRKNIYPLKLFAGTREQRLEYLLKFIGMECGPYEEYRKKLIPFYKALYEEAKSIAVTGEDKKMVESIL